MTISDIILNDLKKIAKEHNKPYGSLMSQSELKLIGTGILRGIISECHGRALIKELAEARCK